ncbi:MAG: SpoIIIAH-like family protein [Clostridia bacterium]
MKVLKKNQIVIFVIALMLVSAGYLNYTATHDGNSIPTSSIDGNQVSIQYAGIGDAKLVSSNGVEGNTLQNELVENKQTTTNQITNEVNTNPTNTQENANTTVTTSGKDLTQSEQYFSSSRLGRDTMYSQMIESYQKILENESISADQKGIAQTEIKKINETKNAIMIAENLIKNKDFDDVVIFVNDQSINVIVKALDLSQDQIAQIQNIIARELKAEINQIHISAKQ